MNGTFPPFHGTIMNVQPGALGAAKKRREALLLEVTQVTEPVVTALKRAVRDVFRGTSLGTTDDRMGAIVRRLVEVGELSHDYSRSRYPDLDELKKRFVVVQHTWRGVIDVEIRDMGDVVTVGFKVVYPKE